MEKPGPRPPHHRIIDEPALKSPFRHLLEGSITLFFWALWIYWLLPVFTALLWFFGIRLFYEQIFPQGGIEEMLRLLKDAGIVFLAILAVIFLWTRYNYFWFLRRGERRNKVVAICYDEDLARFFRVDPAALAEAKSHGVLGITLDGEKMKFQPILMPLSSADELPAVKKNNG
jgi:poly-beta-1,6-N-acetyl-D-glucosamine biosynthesis protein PgaD